VTDNPNEKTMKTETSKPKPVSANRNATGRLYFLEASGGRIHSANVDGSDRKVIVTGCRIPDGIVVDVDAGQIYWTNMGVPTKNDGSFRTVLAPRGSSKPEWLPLRK
jgi:Low-density lipoprotein receptor repeat class B